MGLPLARAKRGNRKENLALHEPVGSKLSEV
jgi:hypothetical protein